MGVAVLVRHGHSTANAQGLLTGRLPGVLLSDAGEEQAIELSSAFNGIEVATISVSPLERTQQTAHLIFGMGEFIFEPGIIECDYGTWSGKALSDLAAEPLWETVQTFPSLVQFPAGESMFDVANRSINTVRQRAQADGIHVFVTHGDVIKAVLSNATGAHLDSFQRIVVDPCSVSLVHFSGEQVRLLASNIPISGAAAALAGLVHPERGTVGGGGGAA